MFEFSNLQTLTMAGSRKKHNHWFLIFKVYNKAILIDYNICRENELTSDMVSLKNFASVSPVEISTQISTQMSTQIRSEGDLLSTTTTNVTWRGGLICEGIKVCQIVRLKHKPSLNIIKMFLVLMIFHCPGTS